MYMQDVRRLSFLSLLSSAAMNNFRYPFHDKIATHQFATLHHNPKLLISFSLIVVSFLYIIPSWFRDALFYDVK